MIIEIRHTGFTNKGAELMLRSIVEKIRENMPNAQIVMAPPPKKDTYLQRGELGLYQKLWSRRGQIQWGNFGYFIPEKVRKMYGLILDSQIDVVLDAAGFHYSDQCGTWACTEAAKSIKKWKSQGSRVIFMPQAFGPFSKRKRKNAFKKVAESADLIYPRDEVSYKHVVDLVGERHNIKIAPDFTNLVTGELAKNFDTNGNRFCIIPNYRMIAKTGDKASSNYIPFLITCAKYLQGMGAKPFILIHEGEKDLWLGQQVAKGLDQDINIVQETHALRIKGIIGASEGVISSRFHGLVSALSQGVPALATAWSHKYEMLFQDYDFPEGVLGVNADAEEICGKIDLIIKDESRQRIRKTITNASQMQKEAASRMWDEVFTMIK